MMKIKKVEFFGVNGVGKSYSEAILRNLLDLRKINTVNRREAIVFHSQCVVELNILDKITLSYFKLIEKFKKPKLNRQKTFSSKIKKQKKNVGLLNFFRRRYNSICKKIYFDYCKKNKSIKKVINKIIIIQNKKNQDLFRNWIYEMFAANYIIDRIKINSKDTIYLCDEGFLQRSFLIMYSNIAYKEKIKILKEYTKFVPKPDLCIRLFRKKHVIENVNRNRKLNKDGIWIEKKNLQKFNNFEDQIFRCFKKNVTFLKIQNNKLFKKKILKKII